MIFSAFIPVIFTRKTINYILNIFLILAFSGAFGQDKKITNDYRDCSNIPIPFEEDFDADATLPACWEIIDNEGNGQVWEFGTHASGLTGTSGNYAYLDSDAYGSGNSQNSDLVSPTFDFTGYSDITLSFTHYYKHYSGSSATVSYSIDNGATWTQIQQWTANTANPETFSEIIANVAGEAQVKFKWNYTGEFDYYWDIDDVEITAVAVTPYANFSASSTEATINETITFTDESDPLDGSFSSWSWDFGSGATPATATGQGPHDVSYSSPGLKTVSLTVNHSAEGNLTETKTDYITIKDLYTLTLSANGNGSFEVDAVEYTTPVEIAEDSSVSIEAIADAQWGFVDWTGDLSGSDNPSSITMDGDKNITANFYRAASATYTGGDIPTDKGFTSLPGTSTCPASLSVNIPAGATITGVAVEYDMTAHNGAWMSEQRSWLRCVSDGGTDEAEITSGTGSSAETFSYSRSGLDIANSVVGGGDINFELHAGRTYGTSGCNTEYNYVDDATWTLTVFYEEMDYDAVWTGDTDNDWNTASNWEDNVVPIYTDDVLIPDACANYPILNNNFSIGNNNGVYSCNSISIHSEAEITVSGNGVEVDCSGDINLLGSFTHSYSNSGSPAFVINNGGIVNIYNNAEFNIGDETSSDDRFNDIEISGGELIIRGGLANIMGGIMHTSGTLEMTGGVLNLKTYGSHSTDNLGKAWETTSSAIINISGGTVNICGGDENDIAIDWNTGHTHTWENTEMIIKLKELSIGGSDNNLLFDFGGHNLNNLTINRNGTTNTLSSNNVVIEGNLTITDGELNSGEVNIEIKGDWINNSVYQGANGTVIFNGEAEQSVEGSSVSDFNNLTVNGSGVILNKNANIDGTLSLTTGLMTTTTTNIIHINNDLESAIAGGSSGSYVNGPMSRLMSSGNTYSFPVGKGGTYYPLSLNSVDCTSAIAGVEAFDGDAGGSNGADILSLSTTEYWHADILSGTFNDATVNLSRQSSLGVLDAIAASSTVDGTYTSLNGTVSGTSIINSDNTGNSLGYFVMAMKQTDPYEIPFIELFTDIPTGEIPQYWARDIANFGASNTANAGGGSPEMRLSDVSQDPAEYYLTTPPINTSGYTTLKFSFKNYLNDYSGDPYTLRVVAIAEGVEYTIDEWVDPADIAAENLEYELTAASHGVGSGEFFLAWVIDGDPFDLNSWYFDDVFLVDPNTDYYTVNFDVTGINGSIEASVDGVAISDGQYIESGSDILFTAIPDQGFQVMEWTLNTAVIAGNTDNTYEHNGISENITVTVEFEVEPDILSQFHNYGGSEQIVFDNAYLYFDDPVFRVSADDDVTRFYIEVSECPDFTQLISFQEFTPGMAQYFLADNEYNLRCDLFTPELSFEANKTYYARVRAKAGNSWRTWSDRISFTYKSNETSSPQWHQTTDAQFNDNSLSGVIANNNFLTAKEKIILSERVEYSEDDADNNSNSSSYARAGDSYDTEQISGFRFRNIQIPQNSEILSSKLFVSGYGLDQSVAVQLGIWMEDSDDPDDFSSTLPDTRTKTTATESWHHNQTWFTDIYYSTPDIKDIVDEIISKPTWQSGNSMVFLLGDDGGSDYRNINSFDYGEEYAAKLVVSYKNDEGGSISSGPIALASFESATQWEKLYWSETGTDGDFTLSIESSADGETWSAEAAFTDINYNSAGHDISALGNVAFIRLQGSFSGSSGATPSLIDWTISCEDSGVNEADLAISLTNITNSACNDATNEWQLMLSNNGPDEATGVVAGLNLPAALNLSDYEASKGVFDGSSWEITSVQVDEAIYLYFSTETTDTSTSPINISAEISSLNQSDNELANNNTDFDLTLTNNDVPAITEISDITTNFNTASGTESFTISDAETISDDLILTAYSSNTDLVPTENIVFGGSGSNRTVSFTPGDYQFGSCEITVEVSDGECSEFTEFTAIVLRHTVNDWTPADIVVGQSDFNTSSSITSDVIIPGASSSSVSAEGVLAVGSQTEGRVLLWSSVPTENGVAADAVVGKTSFTAYTGGCSSQLMRGVQDVAFSPDGKKLIVSDGHNHRILIWNDIDAVFNDVHGAPANVVIGQTDMNSSTSGTAKDKFNGNVGLLVTPNGRLLVADLGNNRVLVFNKIPTEDGASADIVIGQTNMNSGTGGSNADKFDGPWNMALSADGKLFVADGFNSRVSVFNKIPDSNGASADLVVGQDDINVGGFNLNEIDEYNVGEPSVSVSPTGILAVSDFRNHRVTIYNQIPEENGAAADLVLGQTNMYENAEYNDGAGNDGSINEYNMIYPYTISYDINDRLFVSGRNMNRVMVFGTPPEDEADLTISLSALNEGDICYGAETGFVITVENNGTDQATNVVVNTQIPGGFPFTGYENTSGTYQFQGGEWLIPVMENGQTDSLIVYGYVHDETVDQEHTIYAAVRSSNQFDPLMSNNAESITFSVLSSSSPKVSSIDDISSDRNVTTDAVTINIDHEGNEEDVEIVVTSSNETLVPISNINISGTGTERQLTIEPAIDKAGYSDITIEFADTGGACAVYRSFRVYFGDLWIGNTTEWGATGNWSRRAVPGTGNEAYIPSSPIGGNFPAILHDNDVDKIFFEEGASLSVNSGRSLTVNDSITLLGSCDFLGSGTINANTISINSGTLTINETAVNVTDELALNGNIIVDQDNYLLVGTDGLNPGNITATSGSIIGELRHWVANNSGVNINLPIGTEENHRWVIMNYSSAPSAGIISAEFIEDDSYEYEYRQGEPLTDDNGVTINNISWRGVWRIRPVDTDGVSGGTYDIGFNTNGIMEINLDNYELLSMVKKSEDTGDWSVPGTHDGVDVVDIDTRTFWVKRSGVSSFSYYALGGDFTQNPLPVDLLDFNADCADDGINISWTTASEINNDFFTLERSTDANTWQFVKTVPGQGTSSEVFNYEVFDPVDISGTFYYQLIQTDFDAGETIYGPVSVHCEKDAGKLEINMLSHNHDILKVHFTSPKPEVVMEVFDISGKPLLRKEFTGNKLNDGIMVEEMLNAQQGIYLIRLYNKDEAVMKKFVIY